MYKKHVQVPWFLPCSCACRATNCCGGNPVAGDKSVVGREPSSSTLIFNCTEVFYDFRAQYFIAFQYTLKLTSFGIIQDENRELVMH